MSYLLGLDIGTTSIKSVLFNQNGEIVSSCSKNNKLIYSDTKNPNWSYIDPRKLWLEIADTLKASISKIRDAAMIKGIAVTGLGAEGLPLDENGDFIYPAIFLDKRNNYIAAKIKKDFGSEKFFNITGKQILPMDTLLRILWVKENETEVFSKVYKWVLLVDYINYKLCERIATDFSMASCTGMFDLKNGTWSKEILDYFGLNMDILPEIMQSGQVLGYVNKEAAWQTGLAQGTPVVMGGHDFHCAIMAVGAINPGMITDIIGTWEIVVGTVENIKTDKNVYNYGLASERTVIKDIFTIMGSNVAADMLEWFRESFGYQEKMLAEKANKKDWDFLDKLAESSSPGSKGVFFLPHFFGNNSPIIDNYSLGAFLGLNRSASKADILHAIIEGLNYQSRDMIEAIEKITGAANENKITVVGGGTKNKLLMQSKSDITGRILEVPEIKEATALGAAILAGIGAGIYKNEKDALEKISAEKTYYYPDGDRKCLYEKYYQIYKRIYFSIKDINKDISILFHGS